MHAVTSGRWTEVTSSDFAWEQHALHYLKSRLPDSDPFRAWSNFEFIAHNGSINEVDLLVVSLRCVYLVEIKSWRGSVAGDQGTWQRTEGSRTWSVDNPLLLANRKAKKLKGLLEAQDAKMRELFLAPIVFLSQARCRLEGLARTGVYLSENHAGADETNIVDVLLGGELELRRPAPRIDGTLARAFKRAMDQAGIRASRRQQQVSDYEIRDLLLETDTWQDWEAEHRKVSGSRRRIRIYPLARALSEAERRERHAAAEREYRLLDGISHDGILRAEQLTDAERGPAIVFEHDPASERLDHFLDRRGADLPPEARLDLVRQLAETLQYAHKSDFYHRSLNPRRVLVVDPDAVQPRLKVFDWQTGRQAASETQTALGLASDDEDGVYLAPETNQGGYNPRKVDIFSLGAIAYRVFASTPPASTAAELRDRLARDRGLRFPDQMASAPEHLQLVVECATDPDASKRPESAAEFRTYLDQAERELAVEREPREGFVHPLDADSDDLLEGGFLVVRRLGRGATALTLQVVHDDRGGVLKVALDPSHNDRVRREGELLRTLRHANIVEAYREVDLSGHAAIFMAMAGAEHERGAYTLADRIREAGRLSLPDLRRLGDQLLSVVEWLEEKGVSHRDIKPDNIGVSGTPFSVVLFDFSLVDIPAENISAGTPRYRDPFLRLRTPPRWDASAERFSAAMTLYEMATGQLPRWGDGQSDPELLDVEVSLDPELFDPSVRDAFTVFFAKALARECHARFDNAEEMRRALLLSFEAIDAIAASNESEIAEKIDGKESAAQEELSVTRGMLNAPARVDAQANAATVALGFDTEPNEPTAIMAAADDLVLSQASLQDYVECRYRFRLRYLDRLAWPAVRAEPPAHNERRLRDGKAFHHMVHQYLLGVPAERLQELAERRAGADGGEPANWWRAFRQDRPADLPGERFPEVKLAAEVAGRRLSATYDLIVVQDEDRAVILDWKTSARRPREATVERGMQSRVYPYLLARAGAVLNGGRALPPDRIEMRYWFAAQPHQPVVIRYDRDRFEADGELIADLVREIFELPLDRFDRTERRERCRLCTYRSLCDRGGPAAHGDADEDGEHDWPFNDDDGDVFDYAEAGEAPF